MMKKWMAVLSLAALLIMAFGVITSGAWFTDVDTTETASIALGDLDLAVEGDTINITNTEPGAVVGTFTYNIINNGTLVAKYRFYAENLSNWSLANRIEVVVHHGYYNNGVVTPTGDPIWVGRLTDFNSAHPVTMTDLDPEENEYFTIRYKVNGNETGNEFEDATLSWNLKLESTQQINPGW